MPENMRANHHTNENPPKNADFKRLIIFKSWGAVSKVYY
jgi:hypothetical protein